MNIFLMLPTNMPVLAPISERELVLLGGSLSFDGGFAVATGYLVDCVQERSK